MSMVPQKEHILIQLPKILGWVLGFGIIYKCLQIGF